MSTTFRIDPVFDALRRPLPLVADPQQRQAIEQYVEAARFPLERAVFDLLSGLASAVEEQVGDRYRLRLSYRAGALDLEVEAREPEAHAAVPEIEWSSDGEMDKVTIRIPSELKDLATQAAARAGISVNTWFIRVMAGALRGAFRSVEEPEQRRPERRGRGARFSGWIGGE
jgi:hypothetical protein